jgi:hypothetical protein
VKVKGVGRELREAFLRSHDAPARRGRPDKCICIKKTGLLTMAEKQLQSSLFASGYERRVIPTIEPNVYAD